MQDVNADCSMDASGPFFFDENLNGQRYLYFLQNDLTQILCQQDGALPHNSRKFPNKWIGNNGPMR